MGLSRLLEAMKQSRASPMIRIRESNQGILNRFLFASCEPHASEISQSFREDIGRRFVFIGMFSESSWGILGVSL